MCVNWRLPSRGHSTRCSKTSLRPGLKMEQVDMLYMHRWSDEVPLEATFEVLGHNGLRLVRCRHIGVSNYAAWQVMKAERVAAQFGAKDRNAATHVQSCQATGRSRNITNVFIRKYCCCALFSTWRRSFNR